jgi:hypothetical protein
MHAWDPAHMRPGRSIPLKSSQQNGILPNQLQSWYKIRMVQHRNIVSYDPETFWQVNTDFDNRSKGWQCLNWQKQRSEIKWVVQVHSPCSFAHLLQKSILCHLDISHLLADAWPCTWAKKNVHHQSPSIKKLEPIIHCVIFLLLYAA